MYKVLNHSKLGICLLVLLGLAALSPAPIKDKRSGEHELGQQSAAQRTQELKLNGTHAVVGSVPIKTNEDGTDVDPIVGDATAKTIVAAAPLSSDPKALRALAEADRRIELQKQEGEFPWMTLAITVAVVAGLVGGGWVLLQKFGPTPAPRMPLRAGTTNVIMIEDENWK